MVTGFGALVAPVASLPNASDDGFGLSVGLPAPLPARVITAEPPNWSATSRVAAADPSTRRTKATSIAHDWPGLSSRPRQPFARIEKSDGLVPPSCVVSRELGTADWFVTETRTMDPIEPGRANPKSCDAGANSSTTGSPDTPCSVALVLAPAAADTVSTPALAPELAGRKRIATAQVAPAASDVPAQVSLVISKCAA